MTKSYQQVMKQIESLQAEAERLRRNEVSGVVSRIRDAIKAYGLTAADLGLAGGGAVKATGGARRGRPPKAAAAASAMPGKPGRKPGRPRKTTAGSKVAPKYRDENGNTWTGRGKQPVWLRTAINGGRRLEDFLIR